MRKGIYFSLLLATLAACIQEDNKALLIGDWQGASWTIGGADSGRDVADVKFSFRENYTYTASYGNSNEQGTYRLTEKKLYTTAEGANQAEKMVELASISADSIVMNMNRVGTAEQLILVKQK